jgi:hypothetical protein
LRCLHPRIRWRSRASRSTEDWPRSGADAIATVEQKAKDLLAQADAHRELSSNLAHDDA